MVTMGQKMVLNDLCEITSSKRIFANDYQSEGVPFYRGKEIIEKHKGKLEVSTEIFISENKFIEIKKKFGAPKPGDLLLTSVGTIGVPYVVKCGEEFYFKDGNLTWFRNFKNLDSQFLHYWLLSPLGKGELQKCTIGSSQSALTIVLLKGMQIQLPPLPTQHKIASILSAYDDLIENNTRRIKVLEEMAQMIYREWFVKFRFPGYEKVKMVDVPVETLHATSLQKIPEGWEVRNLGEIAQEMRRSIQPNQITPDTPYFGLEHLPRKSIALTDWGFAKEIQSTKLAFKKGEILFGKIRPYFHKVGIAPVDGVSSSDAIVIAPKAPDYFAIVLCCVSSEDFVNHATQTSQGTKMPRANWNVLIEYPVLIPPKPLLRVFNEMIDKFVSQIQNVIFSNRNLRQTRDLLLPRLISGEVGVEGLAIAKQEETS